MFPFRGLLLLQKPWLSDEPAAPWRRLSEDVSTATGQQGVGAVPCVCNLLLRKLTCEAKLHQKGRGKKVRRSRGFLTSQRAHYICTL